MRIPSPIRGSPELECTDMASFISGANDMTDIGAGFAVLAKKPDVGYHTFSGMPLSDANSPLTPSTDQTIHPAGRPTAGPQVPGLAPANTSVPGIIPSFRHHRHQSYHHSDAPSLKILTLQIDRILTALSTSISPHPIRYLPLSYPILFEACRTTNRPTPNALSSFVAFSTHCRF